MAFRKYLPGDKIGELVVLGDGFNKKSRSVIGQCSCGIQAEVTIRRIANNKKAGEIQYCGNPKKHFKLTGVDILQRNKDRKVIREQIKLMGTRREEIEKFEEQIKEPTFETFEKIMMGVVVIGLLLLLFL